MSEDLKRKNTKLAQKLVFVALLMFGFGYALVPIYDVLCDITGQNAKLKEAVEADQAFAVDESREVNVEFITSVNESTPLDFRVETRSMKVHPGQYYTVNFYAKNNLAVPLKAQAIPSITPGLAEEFFKKVQCFCFELQTFAAREEKTMPVRFVVNPRLPERYKTITLSYTFFDRTNNTEN
ncbi:cytochrome c oxidase assembly protein [Methylomonas sp. SURF-2]|uniref:Cytochrome c oxidase assembly protein CtaG n=1 Tax=Methylomonas subterranea TaxID=2952225 RepID=A0ABT1TJN8_9GAMM|nr:cytochrome c oxidase assembly protein [Methylomonas sp. SURF-2]MCQ8105673.1 cytochrome c oxidase assembly protein [Methylomonas sp. SURF-2]